jgi:hypothetical protein
MSESLRRSSDDVVKANTALNSINDTFIASASASDATMLVGLAKKRWDANVGYTNSYTTERVAESSTVHVTWVQSRPNESTGDVPMGTHVVNMGFPLACSCKAPQLDKQPCSHMHAAALKLGLSAVQLQETFCKPFFARKSTYVQ